jgi:2-polyprenyl-3-methyl-5-hydroxy-6-metoxy-1,4-benzoquinol methylase
MINLAKRSTQTELLDSPDLPWADVVLNMQELNFINTWLGGHAITINGCKKLVQHKKIKQLHICEIGCGGGDNLVAIGKWCAKNNIEVRFTGIDIKAACTTMAAAALPGSHHRWICNHFEHVSLADDCPDIVFASLFCHHFSNTELIPLLHWMQKNSRLGFFINDLHRHWLAYYSIQWLTALFSRSYLVKNDAPVSVSRAFVKTDWQALLSQAAIPHYRIQWQWAFRYLIVARHAH